MFFNIFLVCFSFLTLVAPSALPSINTANFQPWKITALYTYTPNGWAGSNPYFTFFASITESNTIPLPNTRRGDRSFATSTANCSTKWIGFVEDDPFDRVIPCEAADFGGIWTMQIQRSNASGNNSTATRDFTLQFKLEESIVLNEGIIRLNFVGRAEFHLSNNLRLNCAASGSCNTWLDEAKSPQLVVPVADIQCLSGVCDYHL